MFFRSPLIITVIDPANEEINNLSGLNDSKFEKNIDKDLFEDKVCKSLIIEENTVLHVKNVKNIVGLKAASGDLSAIAQTMHLCGGELEYSFLLGASECKNCSVMIGFPKLTRHEDKIIATNTRKPMSNIVEKLEEFAKSKICDNHKKGCPYCDNDDIFCENCGALGAINIVKQEINNGLE